MARSFYERPPLLFGVVLFGFIALSFLVAVGPALDVQSRYPPLASSKPMTAQETRGFEIFIAEGCPYCHTQQVRPIKMDETLGRPTVAADYARLEPMSWWMMTPAILGSERTGPDLTTIGERQSSVTWHLLHLYDPRAVVSWSIMPRFRWLFKVVENPGPDATVVPVTPPPSRGKVVATQQALDLVSYLLSRKQDELPSGMGIEKIPASSGGTTDEGASLYAANCAACHQPAGTGIPATFPPLVDDPVVDSNDPTEHIASVLYGVQGRTINGVAYPVAMAPFKDVLTDAQIVAIINHERTSWGNSAKLVTEEMVATVRKAGPPQ